MLHGFDSSCSQYRDVRWQCHCYLRSVGAAASQGAPAGTRVSKQLVPCSQAGERRCPPPAAHALGSRQCAAGEQAGDVTWGKVQNSR